MANTLSNGEFQASKPTSVISFYDRYSRSYVTILRDQDDNEIESAYDGTRQDRDASVRYLTSKIGK